ncbi:ABC transporter ATP binding protein [Methanocella paludicola SANAE]|uniref:ABC transporter ATP binding protein n=1 Tax=Methanocella paludicola (strain DSM 17711 / JCM 13418 / NBRC 101707 / SANAE) TaxID=304371 RepID=D1YVR8_METPS|nr:ABC transporter ATP-binding protein [Methanocella paludicola]BAI60540.1 ABC transporter ATP binding protein [Methanocella paludicola SANAE]
MIKLTGVTKSYKDFEAVKDLSLEVRDGEILGIIGHNGAGKSTTLKMMVGLISPTSGTVEVMGRDMARDGTYVKRFLGYLPEESPLYENMTVNEYLRFFSELYDMPPAKAKERIDLLLDSLKLPERNKLTGELSKGMKRKVAIARALLHDPKLLVLDEPSSGLDPLTSFFIVDYMRRLRNEGKTIVLSAHNLFHVEYVCDRVAIMKNGRLVVCDTMENIRKDLGKREYEVKFMSDQRLDYDKKDGNYIYRTADVGEIASLLRNISENNWALVDMSMKESALEDIYVKLMAE